MLRRRAEAAASRKAVFTERSMREQEPIGSNGGLASRARTLRRSHSGTSERTRGRSIAIARIKELRDGEAETAALSEMPSAVVWIAATADRKPLTVLT